MPFIFACQSARIVLSVVTLGVIAVMSQPVRADPVVSFSFDEPVVYATPMQPIALRATLTVDPSSPDPFVTGAGALLYINGYPSWVLAPLVPVSLFPLYVFDPTAFIDSISNLALAAGQSVSFIYGTLVPQGPVAPGTYAVPKTGPDLIYYGDGAIFASTYCYPILGTCLATTGPFAVPTNTETIVIAAPEPVSLSVLGIGLAMIGVVRRRGA
jgi:hypothetical protein